MRRLALCALALPLWGLAGCGTDTSMTQRDLDAMKHAAPMTDEAKRKMAEGMANGASDAKAAETAWAAKQDPAKVAKINADRAAMGRPPLGGG